MRSSFELTDLNDPNHLDHWRLSLPFGERFGFIVVCIRAGKFITVRIKDRYLPVVVLPPLICSEVCALAMRDDLPPLSCVDSYIQQYISVAHRDVIGPT
jgi:hypothetical protein